MGVFNEMFWPLCDLDRAARGVLLRGGGFVWEHYTVDFEIDWERWYHHIRSRFILLNSIKPMRTWNHEMPSAIQVYGRSTTRMIRPTSTGLGVFSLGIRNSAVQSECVTRFWLSVMPLGRISKSVEKESGRLALYER